MIKWTITYTDYNDVERTEEFRFNLTKAELAKEVGVEGGLDEMIKKIIDTPDPKTIITVLEDLILKSYGVKSADGKRFVKVDENGRRLSDSFKETEAYSNLFMELATDDTKFAKFVNGVIPKMD